MIELRDETRTMDDGRWTMIDRSSEAELMNGGRWTTCPAKPRRSAADDARWSAAGWLALAALLCAPGAAYAQLLGEPESAFKAEGEASTLLFWRNDSDFDSVEPYYSEEGQGIGVVSTFFKPRLAYMPVDRVELFYESELGMNFWSLNSPNQGDPTSTDFMVYKHREIWTKFEMDLISLKSGYQRLSDPSHLFLDHWMGAALLDVYLGNLGGRIFAGQLPDSAYEGVDARDNNFVHDNVAFGADFSMLVLDDALTLRLGAYGMYDHRMPRSALFLTDVMAGAEWAEDELTASLYAHLQGGRWENSAADGGDQALSGWAVAAACGYDAKLLDIAVSAFFLSPDDRHHGNDVQGAFFYSGKNLSRSRMLTEDELRDRYDNLDERMSGTWGSFFVNRAGLAVADVALSGPLYGDLGHEIVFAGGFALASDNAMGHSFVGFETTATLALMLAEGAHLVAVGQVFLPGKAGAVFANEVPGSEAVLPVYGVHAGTLLRF